MILKSITLKNYRSIDTLKIDIEMISDGSFTYGLIGVNEAGKSSILKNLNLINFNINEFKSKDFLKPNEPISIEYEYEIKGKLLLEFATYIKKDQDAQLLRQSDFSNIIFKSYYSLNQNDFRNEVLVSNKLKNEYIIYELDTVINNIFINHFHRTIFWSSEPKYLITDAIDLNTFANNPENVSVPLYNCFKLAGIVSTTDIKERISLLSDTTEIESLRDELGEKVTAHIRRVWPKHPIQITFHLTETNIHFHVKDENVKSKAKTADQRSDGFKRFISFLLTLSAENANAELKNTIILLDEPETHLHPKAQEDLLKELITITRANNNIVLFATHSNYMIDKNHLERNYKISKPKDITEIKKFDPLMSTYASVNYDVFEIASSDYHNELYGKAQEISEIENGTAFDKEIQKLIDNCPIKKDYVHTKGTKFDCSLPTYIRHLIHHPENTKNKKFTELELEKSIVILLELITKLKALKKV